MQKLVQRAAIFFLALLCIGITPLLAQSGADTSGSAMDDMAQATMADLPVPPAPPTNVTVQDRSNDNGTGVIVRWTASADEGAAGKVLMYKVYRSLVSDAPFDQWVERGQVQINGGEYSYVDEGARDKDKSDYFPKGVDLFYRVAAVSADTFGLSASSDPVQSADEWYNTTRTTVLVFVLVFFGFTLYFINVAKTGKSLYVRPLAGIEAVDEAIGRATEMGKPILYVLGLGTASDIATIASFSVLGRVAKKVAEYQTPILVPCYDPIVLTVAEETVKTGYSDAGRPDDYKDDSVYFVTQSQFAYVAAVNGTMLRELPATNIYLGKFYAESLLLAETGAVTGSIQISGTDEIAQLPFFVVACDYTLIGEELYAASVYLNREPILMGTLKAQDYAKAFVLFSIAVGLLGRVVAPDLLHTIFNIK